MRIKLISNLRQGLAGPAVASPTPAAPGGVPAPIVSRGSHCAKGCPIVSYCAKGCPIVPSVSHGAKGCPIVSRGSHCAKGCPIV